MFIDEIIVKDSIPKESYLNKIPAIKYIQERGRISLRSNVSFFVGENGIGKSTLIEAIAVASGFNAEGGTKNFNFGTVNAHSELYQHLALPKTDYPKDGFFLRAESFFNVATYIDDIGVEHNYGGKSLHAQSHGESFISLIQNRFRGNGLYVLDEPEAALSPNRLLMLMALIDSLTKKNCQFIIATHSPILMTYPNSTVYLFDEDGIKEVDYKETEHYQLTKRMIENPQSVFKYLFE